LPEREGASLEQRELRGRRGPTPANIGKGMGPNGEKATLATMMFLAPSRLTASRTASSRRRKAKRHGQVREVTVLMVIARERIAFSRW